MQCSGMAFEEYIEALEVERKKIQVFQRELPLCLELVNQTIDRCKQQLSGTTTTEYVHGQSECSEQTSSEGHHVFEEFMPLKRSSSSDNDEEEEKEEQSPKRQTTEKDNKKKSDWLRSVQLWNTTTDPVSSQKEELPKKASVTELKSNGGAFQPFQREKNVGKPNGSSSSACTTPVASAPATSSNAAGGSNKREEDKDGQNQRKQRRNWSPELHKRFLSALQQLGGSHAATPKQIRELMKVDGLTNDEVKSHLQKYRLHTRRPTPGIHNNGNAQTPQVVFVGGIWMQPSEYAATTGGSGDSPKGVAANGIYAPVAAPPQAAHHVAVHRQQMQNKQSSEHSHNNSEERRMSHSHSEGGVHSNNSPSTSSSTHTTTTSPAF